MLQERFLELIHSMLELPPGTLKGQEALADIEGWDSLAVLNFLAMADAECGLTLPAKDVTAAKTLGDLHKLLQPA